MDKGPYSLDDLSANAWDTTGEFCAPLINPSMSGVEGAIYGLRMFCENWFGGVVVLSLCVSLLTLVLCGVFLNYPLSLFTRTVEGNNVWIPPSSNRGRPSRHTSSSLSSHGSIESFTSTRTRLGKYRRTNGFCLHTSYRCQW